MLSGYADDAVDRAFQALNSGRKALCRFLTANDTGENGAHQAGIFIPKSAWALLFDSPGERGNNIDRWVNILWQDGCYTRSRFIYYGTGTRDEYRITNFGRNFPWLRPSFTGALFVLVEYNRENYSAFVLDCDEDIDFFLNAFGMGPVETGRLLSTEALSPSRCPKESNLIREYAARLAERGIDFPSTYEMAKLSREIEAEAYDHEEWVRQRPDEKLLNWADVEFRFFRYLEKCKYGNVLAAGFPDLEIFLKTANEILNRRKSRAGKSLEHNLAAIFEGNSLQFTSQPLTERSKRPDFIFPSEAAYHDENFSTDRLILLAAKTTCKDRWRQIRHESGRLREHRIFLCTLQQGISAAQMDEMEEENVQLVVPKPYIHAYPIEKQEKIMTISTFINYVRSCEAS